MLITILTCFAVAAAAPWVHRRAGRATGWVLAAPAAALFAWFAWHLPTVGAGATLVQSTPWVPALDVALSFRLDGLSLLFALLISGLGALVVAYAGTYLEGDPLRGRFFLYLYLFLGAMLGVVLADDLLALFVFWELTSVSSYLLIGYKHEDEKSQKSALQALLVTGGGGLALLAGLILLSLASGGATSLSALAGAGEAVRAHALYVPAFVLVAIGAFAKSAQFPLHFWLPNAMAAPTPVSALLHSATMVKAGIYLLARMDPVLGGTALWAGTLSLVGGATMLTGAVLALRQTDLKRILAYSTVTALGTLTLLLGLSFEASVTAFVVFLIVHALYKGALFLVAGIVDHETGSRDVLRLGGLRRALPITAVAAVLAGLSMAGLPPLFGFIGKELTYKAKLGFEGAGLILPAAAVLANALTVAAAGLVAWRPFFGEPRPTPRPAHEAPAAMWIGPLLLAVAGLVFGLFPGLFAAPVVGAAVAAVLGQAVPVKLALWYGFGAALAMSVVTVALGAGFYLGWERLRPRLAAVQTVLGRAPERAYERGLEGTLAFGAALTRGLLASGQAGALRIVFALAAVLAAIPLVRGGLVAAAWPVADTGDWMLFGLVLGAVAVTVSVRSRLTALLSLGTAGAAVALLFIRVGAPDLGMTQLLVEALLAVVAVLVLRRLPIRRRETGLVRPRLGDAAVALGMGGTLAALLLAVQRIPLDPSLAAYYVRESMPSGYGQNVVNVILVDFRALDTLGEITVLAVAALGAWALLRLGAATRQVGEAPPDPVILRSATRVLVPVLLLFAFFLFWRGHNAPGGGFIGGLVAAAGLALCGIAFGTAPLRRVLRVRPQSLVAAGLAIALGSGLLSMVAGAPPMTGLWTALGPAADPLKLGTPLLFDLGVFVLVIGFSLTMVLALEEA